MKLPAHARESASMQEVPNTDTYLTADMFGNAGSATQDALETYSESS